LGYAVTGQETTFEERKWAHDLQVEEKKWLHDLKRDDAKRAHDTNRNFHTYVNKGTVDTANLTLRTLVIINGGAAIAVLTFLGGLAGKEKTGFGQVGVVAGSIKWFAFGVALAVFGIALAYLTNFASAGIASSQVNSWEHPYVTDGPKTKYWRRTNRSFHIAAIIVAIGSIVMFMVGMFSTSDAITHLFEK
jgi:hypothetical protein